MDATLRYLEVDQFLRFVLLDQVREYDSVDHKAWESLERWLNPELFVTNRFVADPLEDFAFNCDRLFDKLILHCILIILKM